MISYREALRIILENVRPAEPEERSPAACAGQVLAQDVHALQSFPPSDVSARDGYALRSVDVRDAGRQKPIHLRVVESIRAGARARKHVHPGTCSRIMTGAHIPEGADCVVQFEDTDEPRGGQGTPVLRPKEVKVYVPAEPGTHIRRAGSAMSVGTLLMTAGTIIGPPQISALVTSGLHRVKVIRRPRIAVIATGDELQSMGRPLAPGKIYNSNGPAVASMVSYYGGIPKVLGIARDREASLLAKIRRGLKWDGIVTTGGVSMGDYDVVRLLMGKEGKPLFSRVKMEPGRAVLFSLLEGADPEGGKITVPLFGLAGPPAAGLVNFEMLVKPALLKMRGVETTDSAGVDAVAADAFSNRRPVPLVKWTILTGSCGAYRVKLCGSRDTGESIPMEKANSLALIPAESSVNPGDTIRVRPLDWGGRALFP